MSEASKATLDDAIRAHIADECEGKTTMHWVLVTYSVNAEDFGTGAGSYYRDVADSQPHHVTDGLLHAGQRITDQIWDDGEPE